MVECNLIGTVEENDCSNQSGEAGDKMISSRPTRREEGGGVRTSRRQRVADTRGPDASVHATRQRAQRETLLGCSWRTVATS
jgi:hypothetical protein